MKCQKQAAHTTRSMRYSVAGAVLLLTVLAISTPVHAVDGVTEIDQTAATAGGVTPGDTPGFPVTINQAGSYRLTSNLTVSTENTTAIEIVTESVTLDLNGFSIIGPSTQAGPNGTGVGVRAGSGVTVTNGTVRGMGSFGVQLDARSRAEKLQLFFNSTGLLTGFDSYVADVNSSRNRQDGISVAGDSTITRCVANENTRDGISVVARCNVTHNTATDNDRIGISTSTDCLVTHNNVSRNISYGLSLNTGTGYSQNIVNANNGGNSNLQVANGGVQIGTNICGGDTACP